MVQEPRNKEGVIREYEVVAVPISAPCSYEHGILKLLLEIVHCVEEIFPLRWVAEYVAKFQG